jgi:outer membrane biosynthesis protein TonB
MYLDFDDHRPETPRVPQAFTRLERVLLAVVAYQFLLLVYFLAPDSLFVKPVKQFLAPDEPIRYVDIQPLVDRAALAKLMAPPSDISRRSTSPTPVPKPDPQPQARGNTPEMVQSAPPTPQAAPTPRPVTGPSPNEAPPEPRAVPGGILGNALRNLNHYVQNSTFDNPQGGATDQGPAIQFDSKGVDFGPWLRRFRAQVYRNWLIPQSANVMHGHVVIQMVILRNGAIVNPHVVQTSGIDAFDSAALTALKLSNPTIRLPDMYPGDAIDPFTVIFYYNEKIG